MSTKTASKNKPRLGRGLSSLISVSEVPIQMEIPADAPQQENTVQHVNEHVVLSVPVDAIVPNPHQPRQIFSEESIKELSQSIVSTGLIQPIIVRKLGPDFQLIAGERRYRAAKLAGLKTIPAICREVDAVTQAQMALIENIQREDLNPMDRAQGYRTLIDQLGLTQEELAGRLGEERSTIANYLRLLELAEPVKRAVQEGKISLGHAKLIAGKTDILEQERLCNLVILQGLSVRNLERVIQQGPSKAPQTPQTDGRLAHLQDLEKNISRQLGLRVQLKSAAKKGKGKLIVHYANLDQFDELVNRLGITGLTQ